MGPREYSLGGKRVSRSTYYRRLAESRDDTPFEDAEEPSNRLPTIPSSSSPSSPYSSSFPVLEGKDSPQSVERSNPEDIHSPALPLSPIIEPPEDEVDIWVGVGFVDGIIPRHGPTRIDLAQAIEKEVVELQGDLDASNVPISVQSKILERIFKKKPVNQHEAPDNCDEMGLAQLITLAESESMQYFVPSSWDELEHGSSVVDDTPSASMPIALPPPLPSASQQISPPKTINYPHTCQMCNAKCPTEVQYLLHYTSQKHIATVILSKKIAQEAKKTKAAAQANSELSSSNSKDVAPLHACGVCNVQCHSEIMLRSHFNGKRHAKNMELATDSKDNRRTDFLYCSICDITCPAKWSLVQHFNGKKHVQNMKEDSDDDE